MTHNEALALVDAALHASAHSIGLTTPPVSSPVGACWIVGASPSGAWSGQAGALAVWTASGWRFLAAREGMRVWLEDQQLWAERRGTSWTVGEVRAGTALVGGEQVLGARSAAVPAPSGGTTVDAEARTAIATLIARLVGHGLIAP